MTKEIETSKGEFVVFNSKGKDFDGFKYNNTYYYKGRIVKLSEITEEELFKFSDLTYSILHFKNIEITPNTYIFKT
ncbi:hypothetical protein ACTS9C_05370 [Empedobacter brevis]